MSYPTDDLSEERLKALWLQAHSPVADQSASAEVLHDTAQTTGQEIEQNEKSPEEEGEGTERKGEGEGGREGGSEEGEGEGRAEGAGRDEGKEEEGGGGEEGEGDGGEEGEGDGGEEGEGDGGGEEGDGGEEKEGIGEVKEEAKTANGAVEEVEDAMVGFAEEPFVQAAAQYQQYQLTGLLELLTQAVDKGCLCHKNAHVHACLYTYAYMIAHVHVYTCIYDLTCTVGVIQSFNSICYCSVDYRFYHAVFKGITVFATTVFTVWCFSSGGHVHVY